MMNNRQPSSSLFNESRAIVVELQKKKRRSSDFNH
jgi:hypothetical protein